jgi:hypothetical protein
VGGNRQIIIHRSSGSSLTQIRWIENETGNLSQGPARFISFLYILWRSKLIIYMYIYLACTVINKFCHMYV